MQVDLDIVVYAVIAALIIGRLWAVLGSRRDDDPQRPNPFVPPPAPPQADPAYGQPQATPSRMPPAPLPPASLAGGLAQVQSIDQSFEEKAFLRNAGDIFTAIVGAYAAGNLSAVAEFLTPPLLGHFQQAVDARKAAGQTAQSRVVRIREAEAVAARAEGPQAFVTTRFVSDQENILRDARGSIIGGVEGKTEAVTDIWTFARDTKTPGAKWVVVETRG